jgi:formylglycine-generating enzyme required for sulfatase activity
LPSEAEWEYAARAGTTSPFAFGATITPAIVNYDGNYPYADAEKGRYREGTTPVGHLGVANAFGLFDMHGNVWEWCQDPWHETYRGAPSDGRVWDQGGDAALRVLRGGSWGNLARYCRSAYRHRGAPDDRLHVIGVRVVCEVART